MELRDAIRAARGSESQQIFATRIGAGIASLQRWESGERRPVHYRHIAALMEAGVPREVLVPATAEEVAG